MSLQTRQNVYDYLKEAFYVRSGNTPECGHTLMYRPHKGTLRPVLPERREALMAHQREMLAGLENESSPSAEWGGIIPQGYPHAFYEGFGINPYKEILSGFSDISSQLVGFNYANLWLYWSHKPSFLEYCGELYGQESIPNFYSWNTIPSSEEVLSKIKEFSHNGVSKMVLKASGAGGFGNKIILPTTPEAEINDFLEKKFDPASTWVSLEEWVDWVISPCTSFFCQGGVSVPLEMCEQVLDARGGFIGGKSYSDILTLADKSNLYQVLSVLAGRIAQSGISGVIGIDTIIGEFDSPIVLPSGLGVKLIEVNPRVNGHNQERFFIEAIADRDSVPGESIHHVRVSLNREKLGTHSRKEHIQIFKMLLSLNHFDEGIVGVEPRFYLDCMHPWRSLYDAVLLYGLNTENLNRALEVLLSTGLTK